MAEKKTVSAREVVADIRVGMPDEQLMLKHGLSAKGLGSLKTKLVTAGLLTAQELDGKSPPTTVADPSADKRAFAKNIADAVKNGLPDAEVIKRFGISAGKLPKVYESLIKAGYLSQEDLNRRGNGDGFEQTVDLAPDVVDTIPKPGPAQAAPAMPAETTKDVLRDFAQRFNIPREELERLKTASIKDIKAFFEKHNIPWSEGMELVKVLGLRAGDFALEAAGKLKNKAKELISKAQAGEGQDSEGQKEPWYNNWIILLILFMCFFPIGLYGLYKNTKLASRTKMIVAGSFCLLLIVGMIGNLGNSISTSSKQFIGMGLSYDEFMKRYRGGLLAFAKSQAEKTDALQIKMEEWKEKTKEGFPQYVGHHENGVTIWVTGPLNNINNVRVYISGGGDDRKKLTEAQYLQWHKHYMAAGVALVEPRTDIDQKWERVEKDLQSDIEDCVKKYGKPFFANAVYGNVRLHINYPSVEAEFRHKDGK